MIGAYGEVIMLMLLVVALIKEWYMVFNIPLQEKSYIHLKVAIGDTTNKHYFK